MVMVMVLGGVKEGWGTLVTRSFFFLFWSWSHFPPSSFPSSFPSSSGFVMKRRRVTENWGGEEGDGTGGGGGGGSPHSPTAEAAGEGAAASAVSLIPSDPFPSSSTAHPLAHHHQGSSYMTMNAILRDAHLQHVDRKMSSEPLTLSSPAMAPSPRASASPHSKGVKRKRMDYHRDEGHHEDEEDEDEDEEGEGEGEGERDLQLHRDGNGDGLSDHRR